MYFTILYAFLTIQLTLSNARKSSVKIVGGERCQIQDHPYIVSIRMTFSNQHFCGGTLVSKNLVMTAAHCCNNKYSSRQMMVSAGSSSSKEHGRLSFVSKHFIASGFTLSPTINHDIGFMQLERAIEEDYHDIEFVKLPSEVLNIDELINICKDGTVVGWGHQYQKQISHTPVNPPIPKHDPHLHCVITHALSAQECAIRMSYTVPMTFICAYGDKKSPCQGDSGGPLMCNGIQYGIVSHGLGCAIQPFPVMYTRVDLYLDMISIVNSTAIHHEFYSRIYPLLSYHLIFSFIMPFS